MTLSDLMDRLGLTEQDVAEGFGLALPQEHQDMLSELQTMAVLLAEVFPDPALQRQ